MSHLDLDTLQVSVLDEIARIKLYQNFLQIAIQQIDSADFGRPTAENLNRIDLLLDTYISLTQPHFKRLDKYSQKICELMHKANQESDEFWNLPILKTWSNEQPKYYIGQTVLVAFKQSNGEILVPGRVYGLHYDDCWYYNLKPLQDHAHIKFNQPYPEDQLEPID
jgi:hypothetical protein